MRVHPQFDRFQSITLGAKSKLSKQQHVYPMFFFPKNNVGFIFLFPKSGCFPPTKLFFFSKSFVFLRPKLGF